MLNQRNVRSKVLVPLSLTFLVLISAFLYSGYKIRQINAKHAVNHRYEGVQFLFRELLQHRVEMMVSALEFVAREEALQGPMGAGNREDLLERAGPLFAQLAEWHGLTHFYFHTPDQTTFLRLHKPDKFGDRVERFTLKQAAESGKRSHGIELGPLGTFTLRVVYPWYKDEQLIGYIELGQELDHVLQTLRSITQIEFVVAIDKKFLDREQWEEGMRMLGRKGDWDLIPNRVIVDQSLPIPREAAGALPCDGRLCDVHHTEFDLNGRHFLAKPFSLSEAGGRVVGDFVLLQDMTGQAQAFKGFIVKIVGFSIVVCAGLFAFTFLVLGRVDRRLAKTQEQLYDQIEKVTSTNELLAVEVAERKRAEEDLKRLNENLEAHVAGRTQELVDLSCELEQANRELEQANEDLKAKQTTILHQDKMACIGQLAAGVAHDINNPIGFVANNLSELETSTADLVRFIEFQGRALQTSGDTELLQEVEEQRRSLNLDYILEDLPAMISESLEGTERVSKIVQNLRTFSRADEVEHKLADIHECLDSTINITWNELRYKADVRREYGELPPVKCYPQQLNQVFMNLLINAAQAIDGRGEITVRTSFEGQDVCIAISDTGSGIPKEQLDQIFEPFFTTKAPGVGTGLGLSITLDIIKRHNGDITIESEEGRGTTFSIRLPIDGELHG